MGLGQNIRANAAAQAITQRSGSRLSGQPSDAKCAKAKPAWLQQESATARRATAPCDGSGQVMPEALTPRRKEVLAQIADSQLAEQEKAEDARKRRRERDRAARASAKAALEDARATEQVYLGEVRDFENGVRQAAKGLRGMIQTTGPIIRGLPGAGSVVSRGSILTRAARYFAAEMFAVIRNDHFGPVRLRYTGRPAPGSSFFDSEAYLVGKLFPKKKTNGEAK